MLAYKLFRIRADGSLGPLFINQKQRIPLGVELLAECHPTKGFAYRPGWHVCSLPYAPHLSEKGRAWFVVDIEEFKEHARPEHQGGLWFTANRMTVLCRLQRELSCVTMLSLLSSAQLRVRKSRTSAST